MQNIVVLHVYFQILHASHARVNGLTAYTPYTRALTRRAGQRLPKKAPCMALAAKTGIVLAALASIGTVRF